MAVKFLDPGGDALLGGTAGFGLELWPNYAGATIVSDFVNGSHLRSTRYPPNATNNVENITVGTLADAGSRINFYAYFVALPNALTSIVQIRQSNAFTQVVALRMTSGGVLQLWNANTTAQIGTDGSTLSTGQWYRISLAYTITNTTTNRFELFVNGTSSISITNASLTNVSSSTFRIGNLGSNAVLDFRTSDHYVDDSSALTDPGAIFVTAKRPNANGTTNGFSTQIGSGGSGYGTGHSPQVNERPLSNVNGWSMIGAGSAVTEEYNIESKATGDINISTKTIIDYMGWLDAKSAISETAQIIVNNVATNISLTSSETIFVKMAGSSTYPAGTGTDIGIITSTTVTTVSLYECGIVVAYSTPAVTPLLATKQLLMGVGQ